MASANDFFMKVGRSTATTLASPGYTTGDTSINVASTTNWPADTGVTFAIDEVDSNGLRVSGTYNVFRGKVAGGTQIDEVTYVGGDTNRNYSAGATTRVYILVSSYRDNRFTDGILEEHKQDGTHGDVHATSIVSTGTIEATEFITTGAGGSQGWETGLPTPNTVTYNGNHSYDLVFNSTDLTDTLSPGMRLRTTRTVAAPTQCTSLNGTSQYWSKSSPNGMTFTDDFVVGAWVKLSSYGSVNQTIASRWNGTSGWELRVQTSGQILLSGYNAGGTNFSYVLSYQSIPLNKWVHVTAQLDMSSFTASTTTSYIMLDGVDVPALVARGGTNPTALVQAGNLEIGGGNGGLLPFPGKIAQAFVSSAKITQANVRTLISQGLTASLISTHSIVSAYDFNGNANDLNTTNANNLTASGSATATNADSPFALGNDLASAYTKGTTDFGVVMATSFSTNTTVTVQVPEGCTIPTSGGVSAVYYSTQDTPYGFPRDRGLWRISAIYKANALASASSGTWSLKTGAPQLSIPSGRFIAGYGVQARSTVSSGGSYVATLAGISTATSGTPTLPESIRASQIDYTALSGNPISVNGSLSATNPVDNTSITTHYLLHLVSSNGTISSSTGFYTDYGNTNVLFAECAYV